jgi:hypothetical protein
MPGEECKGKLTKKEDQKQYPLSLNPSHKDQSPNPKNNIVVM